MTNQKISELETKILNCVRYSPHSMSVKPTLALELIAYILASQAQPTPSQSDYERAELALFKEWFQSVQGIEYQGIYTFAHDAWMARAQLSKPQPTSQEVENNPNSAVLPNGKTCTNVYEAYEIGKAETHHKPQPTSQDTTTLAIALEALAWADGHLNSESIKRAIASVQKAIKESSQ